MKHVNVGLFVPHNGCPHQCTFCNQRAISGQSKQVTPSDVDEAVKIAMNNPDSRGGEIAFFGGSFTAIDRDVMVGLLKSDINMSKTAASRAFDAQHVPMR